MILLVYDSRQARRIHDCMHVDFGAHGVKTVTGWQWICLGSEGVKSMQTLSRKGDPENCTIIHQVVETSVNVTSNSPSQDYTRPNDHNLLT